MKDKSNKNVFSILLILLIVCCQHFQLTYSASIGVRYCLTMDVRLICLNMLVTAIPLLLILLIFQNVFVSMLISSVLITTLSIINYHVFLFHGTPFLASEFKNIATAIDVLNAYKPVFDKMVIRLLLITLLELFILLLFYKSVKNFRVSCRIAIPILVTDCLVLWLLFFSTWTIFPNSLVSWSWVKPMSKYGYEVCFVNSMYCVNKKYSTIEGYNPELLYKYLLEEDGEIEANKTYPDIILILNEALGDLDYCSSIPEGSEALELIKSIEGIISGYAVVPLIGGGTNCSEYELLTSNDMYELSTASPFAALDLSEANSVVHYLKSLGYYSAAMHCYSEENYARNIAYPALGFDEVYLGKEHFIYNSYGKREWLDRDNYEDLLRIYKSAADSPRFMYLLTFQNHGGYEQNQSEMDTVHVDIDLGQYTDDVDEYLTSIRSCAEGFCYLIEELSNSNRPVVVLMVGDHEPSFISELPVSAKKYQSSVVQRTVPYFIWTNIEINKELFTEISSLTDLLPMLINATGMPLTSYYRLINELHLSVPVRTSDGIYYNAEGIEIYMQSNDEYSDLIRDYYYMEYNNISHGEDYLAELFTFQ